MRKYIRTKIIASVFVWVFVCMEMNAGLAGAEIRHCLTTGKEPIADGNMETAKNRAVDSALETAVQFAAVSLVTPEILNKKLDSLYHGILDKKEKFLVSYKVLGETDQDGVFMVGVESRVNLDMLKEELIRTGILQDARNQARILLLMAEQGPEDVLPKYWWGRYPGEYESKAGPRIREKMTAGQFQICPAPGDLPNPGEYGIEFSSIYDGQAAMNLARTLGASLVILGKTRVAESSNRSEDGLIYEANIDVTIYDPAEGTSIFTDSFQATAKQGAGEGEKGLQAIEQAVQLAGTKMIDVCRGFFVRGMKKETHFQLILQGENFLPRFLAVKQKIMDMPGVIRVQPLQMGVSKAVIDMVYQGAVGKFADQLMLKSFPDFGVQIAESGGNSIALRFIEK